MKNQKVSIVILDFFKAEKVVANVKSILTQNTELEIEIIVIDNSVNEKNASTLKQLEQGKNLCLIINEKNIGYTKGNNLGSQYATGEFLAIVNPDIFWKEPDTLQKLVDFLQKNKEIGVLAPAQINPDDSVATTVRAFPNFIIQMARRTFLRRLPAFKSKVEFDEMQHLNYSKTQSVSWVQSSFIMMRKDFWDECGGFNEKYFLFMADAELCWQVWSKGKKVVFYPETKVYADGLRCSRGGFLDLFTQKTLWVHIKDSFEYTKKHFFEKPPRVF
jgi:GT2 family glycosyltransferase